MPDRPRILIIDDDRAITSTVAPLLRDLADCDTAHSPAEALEKLASHAYAAVILDVVLGDDPSALHEALSSREVPVLLISGRDPDALARIATTRGWSYAAKPLSPSVLRGLVADLVGVDAPEPTQRGRTTAPTPAPAPEAASKASAPAPPAAVMILDKLGDIVGMLVVGYLCASGKLSGELAVAVVAGIAGVGTTARAITGRSVGAASAAVALAALVAATPAPAHAVATDRPRAHITPSAAALLTLLVAMALAGCGGPVLTNPVANGAARIARPSIHKGAVGAGLCDEDPPEWLVGVTPHKDAGASADVDASPGAPDDASSPGPGDASATAASDGGSDQ